jgi:hypothetical protein
VSCHVVNVLQEIIENLKTPKIANTEVNALPTQSWPNNQKQNEIKIKVGQQQENYEMT